MIRDQPSWLLPPGAVYDSLNCVYDVQGIARQRMGSTAIFSGNQSAFATSIGFAYSQDATTIEELYGLDGKAGALNLINKTTGSATALAAAIGSAAVVGRPVRHFGFCLFPYLTTSTGLRGSVSVAGQTSATTFTNAVAQTITAGTQQITLAGGDLTTNIKVGSIVQGASATNKYYGRVVSIDSGTTFTVWPTPPTTIICTIANLTTTPILGARGGVCGASFQNRLLWGNTNDISSVSGTLITDRRVYYSPLPTESSAGYSTVTSWGAVFAGMFSGTASWPVLNWFEIPGNDSIVAMEPVSDNQLLILTSTHPVVFSGNLTTQLATTSPTITFDLSDINVNAGCLSDMSVQRTPRGVVWAGPGGIYAWDGRQPVDLTTGTIGTFWRAKVRGSNFAVHGSAYVRGCYILSYSSGGSTEALIVDLTSKTPKWGRASGVGTDNFFGVARPTDPSQVFAIRWWDVTGAAPTMLNGQTVRVDSMLAPYVPAATTTDADGTAVTVSLTTRTITGDPELQKLWQRGTIRHQQNSTTAAVAVTAKSTLDAAEVNANATRSLGSLSNTSVLTVISATNANPIVVTTTPNHGYQTDDFVDIDGVTGNTNANGRWRIAVTGVSTFSLVGGIGNGTFGGSPTCKKLTETDYLMSPLNAGQGVSLKFDGAPNNWEYHGARIAAMVRQPVMSA
jgi:hypothetical protein